MGAPGPRARSLTRRRVALEGLLALGAALTPVGFGGLGGAPAAAQEKVILFVSRKRLLNETTHARQLLKAEIDLTAGLQAEIDAIKEELAAEEQELTHLRSTLDRKVFESRVSAFDRKVRAQRREAQERAAALQSAFRAERVKLVDALGPLLEEVRTAFGASVILNADEAMAADHTLDITDEAIERFNASVPAPEIPALGAALQTPQPTNSGEAAGNTSEQ